MKQVLSIIIILIVLIILYYILIYKKPQIKSGSSTSSNEEKAITVETKSKPKSTLYQEEEKQEDIDAVCIENTINNYTFDDTVLTGEEILKKYGGEYFYGKKEFFVLDPSISTVTSTLDPKKVYKVGILKSGIKADINEPINNGLTCLSQGKDYPTFIYVPAIRTPKFTYFISGRYIRITQPNNAALNIGEIKIYDKFGDLIPISSMLSSSSSVLSGYPMTNLVDGNNNTFAHTLGEYGNWIQIDLQQDRDISNIVIINRQDCCQDRIKGSIVSFKNNSGVVVWQTFITSVLSTYVFNLLYPIYNTCYSNVNSGYFTVLNLGNYTFVMQDDGNLVLHYILTPLWWSGTSGINSPYQAKLNTDGDIQIFDKNNTRIWSLNSLNGMVSIIQQNGGIAPYSIQIVDNNVSIIDAANKNVWSLLNSAKSDINNGLCNLLVDKLFKFIVQNDGNVVLYNGSTAIWNSGTYYLGGGFAPYRLNIQSNGNLKLYDKSGLERWNLDSHFSGSLSASITQKAAVGPYTYTLTNGNLFLYDSAGKNIWNLLSRYSWNVDGYNPGNINCIKTPIVSCRMIDNNNVIVSDTLCTGIKPTATQEALNGDGTCRYYYTTSGWSLCGNNCQQTRSAICTRGDGTSQTDLKCSSSNIIKPTTTQPCRGDYCPYYFATSTSACDTNCRQTISYICKDQYNSQYSDAYCASIGLIKPPTSQPCVNSTKQNQCTAMGSNYLLDTYSCSCYYNDTSQQAAMLGLF